MQFIAKLAYFKRLCFVAFHHHHHHLLLLLLTHHLLHSSDKFNVDPQNGSIYLNFSFNVRLPHAEYWLRMIGFVVFHHPARHFSHQFFSISVSVGVT